MCGDPSALYLFIFLVNITVSSRDVTFLLYKQLTNQVMLCKQTILKLITSGSTPNYSLTFVVIVCLNIRWPLERFLFAEMQSNFQL